MQPNKDIYDPDYYNVKSACEDAGYYWYDDCCNEDPETFLPWNKKELLPEAGGDHDRYTIPISQDGDIDFTFNKKENERGFFNLSFFGNIFLLLLL